MSEPRTEAGRRTLNSLTKQPYIALADPSAAILAIEVEAGKLDVERLREALDRCAPLDGIEPGDWAPAIAAEYERLSE